MPAPPLPPLDDEDVVWIGLLRFTITTPGARSLKEKRALVRPIVDRLRHRYPVSLARVGGEDRHDQERVAVVVANRDPEVCRSVLDRALATAERDGARLERVETTVERW